ncbi:hypothetical protein [Bacillus albus]|uniref:Uncharacterized protein n=1 Tax=Bacillus albus TaxID=2026189 RepID=A0A1J9TRP8_9BACI|nr:hypothetical protein [Bacillus albus]OJD68944.1 hypothetical protein BAU25_05070 [Bacillus albus]WJE70008.1 hypothetical protein QRY64_25290 [Bacillus albus]
MSSLHVVDEGLHTESCALHTVRSSFDGRCFIVSASEVSSLMKRINTGSIRTGEQILSGATPSLESLLFHKDILLIPRYKNNYPKIVREYKPLNVLKETDAYVWYCRKEIFDGHPSEMEAQFYQEFTQVDQDILDGNMSVELDRRLTRVRSHAK